MFAMISLIAICLAGFLPSFVSAQSIGSGGLEVVWRAQVDVPQSRKRQTQVSVHLSKQNVIKAYEVVFDGGSRLFAPQHIDRQGRALGETGAAHMADVELRVLKSRGIEAEIIEHATPRITLYAQSTEGILYTIDGETGEIRWQVPIGRADYPNMLPAANDDYAAVVNGSTLHIVSLADGKLAWTKRLPTAPSNSPVVTDTHVFVPLHGGMLDGYSLDEEVSKIPLRTRSLGSTQAKPVLTGNSITWPTDRGFLYSADKESGKVRFRMEARSNLVSNAAFLAPNRIFVGSIEGYLFCVNEKAGGMLWQFSSGESLASAPFASGDSVYAMTSRGSLFAVNSQNGIQRWQTSGIRQIVSASEDYLHCVGDRDQLVMLDRKSGGMVSTTSFGGRVITNTVSDRIYVVTDSGQLVCLRQQNQQWPSITNMVKEIMVDANDKSTPTEKVSDSAEVVDVDSAETDEEDPFESEEDVFGDEDDAMDDDGDDAFGDDEDAFGDDEDAFGDDEDAFGDDEELFN